MNTVVAKRISNDSQRAVNVKDIKITDRRLLRRALMVKHGTLTEASEKLGVPYARLLGAIKGREQTFYVIHALQSDLGLTDDQVLSLWPLLRSWPREIK